MPAIEIEVGPNATVADVVAAVAERAPALREVIGAARPVVNREFAGPEQPIAASDEVALLPPVSGG
ncbi:MAG TPA: MoaD/ThiS family protein [Chloroflexota bacterium]|jgi:molybdopterin converting factor small subunit